MNTYRKTLSIVLLIIGCYGMFSTGRAAWAGEKIVMVTPLSNTEVLGKWVDLIFREAFKRIGLEMEYRQLPAARCAVKANLGEVAGELGRPLGFDRVYPNLVRVEEPSIVTYYVAYVTNPKLRLNGWYSLKNTGYRVDYLRGAAISEKQLKRVVTPDKLSALNQPVQGFLKLTAGRTDVFVIAENMVEHLLLKDEFKTIRKAGMMQEIPMYPYLNKTYAYLAPQLAQALKQMKKDGEIERLRRMALEAINVSD